MNVRCALGKLVNPDTQVISLVQRNVWVEANYKETQLRNIHAGDPAEIRVDAFPEVTIKGKVGDVSPASGSQFALLPQTMLLATSQRLFSGSLSRSFWTPAKRRSTDCDPAFRLSPQFVQLARASNGVSHVPVTDPKSVPPATLAAPQTNTNPYIGTLGVFLGAGIATLNASLISAGPSDIKGANGFGFDEASWIPTVLDMAMMCSGVFCVFLNARLGPRRILLPCAALFTVASIAAPSFSKSLGAACPASPGRVELGDLLFADANVRSGCSSEADGHFCACGLCG